MIKGSRHGTEQCSHGVDNAMQTIHVPRCIP